MKVFITLDKIDGSQSRLRGPIELDEINLHGLLLRELESKNPHILPPKTRAPRQPGPNG